MGNSNLYILWTNADLITSEKMVFMYGKNAKVLKWWDEVTLIIWGATAKLSGENTLVQEWITDIIQAGVKVSACKACADALGVSGKLRELGVEVKYWGEPLTDLLKTGQKLLTI